MRAGSKPAARRGAAASPASLLAAAKAVPTDGLGPHRETIRVLREKGQSWRKIAAFLAAHGVVADHTTVYRFAQTAGLVDE